jgi:exodeoxyribonuclease VII large subunit
MVDSQAEAEYPHLRCAANYGSQFLVRQGLMSQLPLFEQNFWSVTRLTRYLRDLLESDARLQDLWVQGEISNLSRPSSGHMYFTLKDAGASLRCVMWRTAVARQGFTPREGEAVEVHGSINIYEASGQYQLYADTLRPVGQGALYQEFLRLKARLEAEGLFDPERKRPLPRWPHKIGIVTSPTGAALRDMLNTIRRRYPLAEIILAPSPVQGDEAPPGIVAGLWALNTLARPDVILLARGGGSIEDLWAFNDERVARAIADSAIPVISGVGHETDFTIADFVSDLRAPTPTAAAELATPNRVDLLVSLQDLLARSGRALQISLNNARWVLHHTENQLHLYSPQTRIRSDRQRLDELERRAISAIRYRNKLQISEINGLQQRLAALNPLAVLGRGYAVVMDSDGQAVRSIQQVHPGDQVQVQVSDGAFDARVEKLPEHR